jgi:GT2 family glycosyltransferase
VLARRNALHEIGLCDELFFMYMDDLDWGWRGKMFGWESTDVPSSIVYHAWSEISRISSKFYHLESGRIIALAKNVTFRSVLVLSPILIICEMAVLINASLNGWLREKIQSYAHLLKIMNLVLKRRKRLMQQRNVSDRLILRNFVTEMRHPYIGTAGIGLGKVSNLLFRLLRTLL